MKFKIGHIMDNVATWGIMLSFLLSGIGAGIGACLLISMPTNDWWSIVDIILFGETMTVESFIKAVCVFNILLFATFNASFILGYISVFLLGDTVKEES